MWPTISTQIQKNIRNKKISLVNTTIVQTEQLVPDNLNYTGQQQTSIDGLVDAFGKVSVSEIKKSREEIVAERKQRKLVAKQIRQQKSIDKKLEERRTKSQKIQIIDTEFLEIYNKSNSTKQPDSEVDGNSPNLTSTTKNRIKQRLKSKNIISFNLVELLESKIQQKSNVKTAKLEKKPIILSNLAIKRRRGKQREFQKAKPFKRLKRSILAIRLLRQELREKTVPVKKIDLKLPLNTCPIQYSRKFRPYCENYVTVEINIAVESLLKDLFRFQKRAYEKSQIKSSSKRRYIVGFNEVKRNLEMKKVKLLIIAPDLEPNEGVGGLDDTVHNIKLISQTNDIPYVFAISRWRIGRILFKKVSVSCVAVLNCDGAYEQYKTILNLVDIERKKFIKDKSEYIG